MPATPIRLRHAGQLRFPPDWTMGMHAHSDFHELIVLYGGALEVRIHDGPRYVGEAGQTFLYRRGVPHEEYSIGDEPIRMVCISFVGDLPRASEPDVIVSDTLGRARSLAAWMAELCADASRPDTAARDALMVALLSDRAAGQRPGADLVNRVQEYLREHLPERITLEDLAAHACVSPFHFARRFRAAAGVPPMAFVRRTRVEAARSLLTAPGLPLRRIAELVGFRDEFELSRVFKRVTGAAPRGRGSRRRSDRGEA